MKAVKPWVKPLNVKFQEYETWTTQVDVETSITFWALDRRKLRTQDYLHWAREHYKIPVLKDPYFRDEASGDLYFQMKSVANWSAEMIPLTQWEGIVYVGCVEPPEDVKWSFPVRYVLVSARTLKKFWNQLQHEETMGTIAAPPAMAEVAKTAEAKEPLPHSRETSTEASEPVIEAPSLELNVPTLDSSEAKPIESPDGFELNIPTAEVAQTEKPVLDVPEGMDVSADAISSAQEPEASEVPILETPEGISMESDSEPVVETPQGISMDTPEGFSLNIPEEVGLVSESASEAPQPEAQKDGPVPEHMETATKEPQVSAPVAVSLDSPPPVATDEPEIPKPEPAASEADAYETPPPAPPPRQEAVAPPISETDLPTTTSPPAPPIPSESAAVAAEETAETIDDSGSLPMYQDHEATGNTKTHFGMTLTGVNKMAAPEAVVDLDNDLPASLEAAESDKQVAAWAFNELKQIYNTSMILTAAETKLTPWKWESLWSPENEKAFETFEGNKPGVFRIVARTKQPYHGFVVDSPANVEFFTAWGYLELPKHVSVLPLKVDGHMIGMLLCVGEEAANTTTNLNSAMRIAETLGEHLKKYFPVAA